MRVPVGKRPGKSVDGEYRATTCRHHGRLQDRPVDSVGAGRCRAIHGRPSAWARHLYAIQQKSSADIVT